MVLLWVFSGFSINPASGCRMEHLSHVTGRRSYLATWASSAWTRPLKMLSLWGTATLIIHFFVSFPRFSLSFFHYTLIADICSSNATHWCFAGQNVNKISCIIWKWTVNRLQRNKQAFKLATHFPVDEKLRHGNSVCSPIYVSVRHCWTAVVCALPDPTVSYSQPFFGTKSVVIWGAVDV